MKRIFILFFTLLLFSTVSKTQAQTHIITHDIDWETHNQNMWGPNGSPWNINMDINLFSVEFDTSLTFGYIENILGGQFGAEFDIDSWFKLGSDFIISGFTTGSVDVNYPVRIELEVPDDDTYCPGDSVTIQSEYEVRPGWDLSTHFPTAGVIGLYMDFGFDLDLDATVCVFSCTTFPIIDVSIPYDTITIIELNSQTGVFTYPCYDPNSFPPFGICHDTILPITFNNLFNIGLSGSITIPYVETTDWLDDSDPCHQTLYAAGDSTWVQLELDVIQFLSAIAGLIPPPQGPAIQQFLGMLSGTYDLGGGFTIDYNLFSAWFTILSTMQQDFTFRPYVWNNFTFPQAVGYTVQDPTNGNAIVDQGMSNQIRFLACHNLTYQWPCENTDQMDIGVSHSLTNDFTNHTWDSLSFDFSISALEFTINIPILPVVPPVVVPDLCIDVPVYDTVALKSYIHQACMPGIEIPGVYSLGQKLSIHIGPLFAYTWPLGYIPITWYDNTWNLAGFQDTIFPPFNMATSCPGLEITGLNAVDVLCYGDSTGTLTVTVINGEPPYTYDWSNGFNETTASTSSSISNLQSDWYWITVTDANGCSAIDSAEIVDAFPPLSVMISYQDITCVGGNDGYIGLNVSGGLPPYQYNWDPAAANSNINSGLVAGTYSVTITDANGCDTSVTQTLIELYPLPPVAISASPTEGCQPLFVELAETSIDEGQTYLWDLDEGFTFTTDKNPSHWYYGYGYYDITIVVTSIHGCVDSLTIVDMIKVHRKPEADFRPYPEHPDMSNPTVLFFNQSTNTYLNYWTFSDGGSSMDVNPYHTFPDTGYYDIELIVETEFGCKDTTEQQIRMRDIYTFYVPNSFTPDGDGINDFFKPEGYNVDPNDYDLKIFDRWGKLLFHTNDVDESWDGTLNGVRCQHGVYQYVILYGDKEGIRRKLIGGLQLIR